MIMSMGFQERKNNLIKWVRLNQSKHEKLLNNEINKRSIIGAKICNPMT